MKLAIFFLDSENIFHFDPYKITENYLPSKLKIFKSRLRAGNNASRSKLLTSFQANKKQYHLRGLLNKKNELIKLSLVMQKTANRKNHSISFTRTNDLISIKNGEKFLISLKIKKITPNKVILHVNKTVEDNEIFSRKNIILIEGDKVTDINNYTKRSFLSDEDLKLTSKSHLHRAVNRIAQSNVFFKTLKRDDLGRYGHGLFEVLNTYEISSIENNFNDCMSFESLKSELEGRLNNSYHFCIQKSIIKNLKKVANNKFQISHDSNAIHQYFQCLALHKITTNDHFVFLNHLSELEFKKNNFNCLSKLYSNIIEERIINDIKNTQIISMDLLKFIKNDISISTQDKIKNCSDRPNFKQLIPCFNQVKASLIKDIKKAKLKNQVAWLIGEDKAKQIESSIQLQNYSERENINTLLKFIIQHGPIRKIASIPIDDGFISEADYKEEFYKCVSEKFNAENINIDDIDAKFYGCQKILEFDLLTYDFLKKKENKLQEIYGEISTEYKFPMLISFQAGLLKKNFGQEELRDNSHLFYENAILIVIESEISYFSIQDEKERVYNHLNSVVFKDEMSSFTESLSQSIERLKGSDEELMIKSKQLVKDIVKELYNLILATDISLLNLTEEEGKELYDNIKSSYENCFDQIIPNKTKEIASLLKECKHDFLRLTFKNRLEFKLRSYSTQYFLRSSDEFKNLILPVRYFETCLVESYATGKKYEIKNYEKTLKACTFISQLDFFHNLFYLRYLKLNPKFEHDQLFNCLKSSISPLELSNDYLKFIKKYYQTEKEYSSQLKHLNPKRSFYYLFEDDNTNIIKAILNDISKVDVNILNQVEIDLKSCGFELAKMTFQSIQNTDLQKLKEELNSDALIDFFDFEIFDLLLRLNLNHRSELTRLSEIMKLYSELVSNALFINDKHLRSELQIFKNALKNYYDEQIKSKTPIPLDQGLSLFKESSLNKSIILGLISVEFKTKLNSFIDMSFKDENIKSGLYKVIKSMTSFYDLNRIISRGREGKELFEYANQYIVLKRINGQKVSEHIHRQFVKKATLLILKDDSHAGVAGKLAAAFFIPYLEEMQHKDWWIKKFYQWKWHDYNWDTLMEMPSAIRAMKIFKLEILKPRLMDLKVSSKHEEKAWDQIYQLVNKAQFEKRPPALWPKVRPYWIKTKEFFQFTP